MEFEISGPFKANVYQLMKDLGYFYQKKENDELSFVRPPKGFPRFHIYLKVEKDKLIFNLHLDQKAPIYEGAKTHAGEYDGKVVEEEAERIKRFLEKFIFRKSG